MHLIIGAIVALGGLVWAINHLMNGAADARSAARRLQWHTKHSKDPFAAIDDPRISAAILFGQLRRYAGDISTEDRQRLTGMVETEFRTPHGEAVEIVAQGLYALGQKTDAANDLGKLLAPIRQSCTQDEQHDLLRLMALVAAWDGAPNEAQVSLVDRTRHRLTN